MKEYKCARSIHKRFLVANFIVIALSVMIGGYLAGEVLSYFVQTKHMGGPANMVYHLANTEYYNALKKLAENPEFPVDYWVVDSELNVITSSSAQKKPPLKKSIIPTLDAKRFVQADLGIGAVKLETLENRYLVYSYKEHGYSSYWWFYSILFLCFFFSVVIGSSVFYIIIMSRFKKQRERIEIFLTELQKGNLKARIPIKVMDERGLALSRFNNMADEIERLVEELKRSDRSRVTLLQELAHDLRTPVASLRSMLETLFDKWEKVSEDTRQEFLDLSLKEVKYFSRLVEDLLFLARVSEPKYRIDSSEIEISKLVEGAIDGVGQSSVANGVTIESNCQQGFFIADQVLIDRLIRNALTNACSYAAHRVEVNSETFSDGIRITINDDGKGFDKESLEKFGERKFSRKINERSKDGRLTVGLGSSIMKRVVDIHGGELNVRNIIENDEVLGAEVDIFFPTL